jgi:Fur family zinc uptake transcriptional regulator
MEHGMGKRGKQMQTEILSILRDSKSPHSAYTLLDRLQETYPKIAPPTVYRALAALGERGQIHRLETLKAYVACQSEAHHQTSVLSICEDCGVVEETFEPDIFSHLSAALRKSGFSAQRFIIEVNGICASCGPAQAAV